MKSVKDTEEFKLWYREYQMKYQKEYYNTNPRKKLIAKISYLTKKLNVEAIKMTKEVPLECLEKHYKMLEEIHLENKKQKIIERTKKIIEGC
jgi:hypothetical protein